MKEGDEPAFPEVQTEFGAYDEPNTFSTGGLTKREWFAGMAMQGLIAATSESEDWPKPELIATLSYGMADAMLAFKEKEAGEAAL